MAADAVLRHGHAGNIRFALVEQNGALTDLYADRIDRPSLYGAVIMGEVQRLFPGNTTGVASLGDYGVAYVNSRTPLVSGEVLPLQVRSAANGEKHAKTTNDIALAGRGLVHLPLGAGISFSSRLTPQHKKKLNDTWPHDETEGGWIVRRNAAELAQDLLLSEIHALRAKALYIRDHPFGTLCVPPLSPLERARAEAHAVDLRESAADAETWHETLERENLTRNRVELGTDGSLLIEPTAAGLMIDVNGTVPATQLNAAALKALPRLLRLRQLSGQILMDLVGRPKLDTEKLSMALEHDPVPCHLYGLSRLGLLELTRERRGYRLDEILDD